MHRMWRKLLLTVAAALLVTAPVLAQGGNIVLTGHDDDFHFFFGSASNAGAQLKAMVNFARAGSANPSLPVLTFDHGGSGSFELRSSLTTLGIPHVDLDPNAGVPTAAQINPALYSAVVVASDQSCGGCDNDPTSAANLAAAAAAFQAFNNAGGGIVALAAGSDTGYYNFIPGLTSVTPFGSPPSTGYVATPEGILLGIPAVNGDPTHNFLPEPGTGGVPPGFQVLERNPGVTGDPAVTIGGANIILGPAIPEPTTLALTGIALVGLAGFRGARRMTKAV